jgi:hypothetical protein
MALLNLKWICKAIFLTFWFNQKFPIEKLQYQINTGTAVALSKLFYI